MGIETKVSASSGRAVIAVVRFCGFSRRSALGRSKLKIEVSAHAALELEKLRSEIVLQGNLRQSIFEQFVALQTRAPDRSFVQLGLDAARNALCLAAGRQAFGVGRRHHRRDAMLHDAANRARKTAR